MSADISPDRLRLFAPQCDAALLAPYISAAAQRCKITTPRRVSHWAAHLSAETAGLTRFTEDLDYSAARLCQVWPGRFPTLAMAQPYAHNPAALGERVYGGRLGNALPGDGGRFIGRGGLQRTGRSGYLAAQAALGADGIVVDLIGHPELLAEPQYAFEDAASFWLAHGLNAVADAGPDTAALEQETRIINGGLTSWDARQAALRVAQAIWTADGPPPAQTAPKSLADAANLRGLF